MAGNKRDYKLNIARINKYLDKTERDWGWVILAAQVDRRTVERWQEGRPARIKNIAYLAAKMKLSIQEICAETVPPAVLNTFQPSPGGPGESPPQREGGDRYIELDVPGELLMSLSDERKKQLIDGIAMIIGSGVPVRFEPDKKEKK